MFLHPNVPQVPRKEPSVFPANDPSYLLTQEAWLESNSVQLARSFTRLRV